MPKRDITGKSLPVTCPMKYYLTHTHSKPDAQKKPTFSKINPNALQSNLYVF
ncbi:MAG TPA: hypothetical protein PK239_18720 [Chitinophagales bacterium]|nr:hypothetical protein [Chitinophagales bacterium]